MHWFDWIILVLFDSQVFECQTASDTKMLMVPFFIKLLKKVGKFVYNLFLFMYFHINLNGKTKWRTNVQFLEKFQNTWTKVEKNLREDSKQDLLLLNAYILRYTRKMSFWTLMHENEKLVGGRKRLKVLMAKKCYYYYYCCCYCSSSQSYKIN